MNKNIPGAVIIEGHVQGLSNTRSLGEIGVPVIVVDKTNCIARYSKFCNRFFKCPDFIEDSFAYFLIDLARNENIKDWILIPSNDHAVFTISKHKKDLEEYYKVMTSSIEIINNIYDKSKLLRIAEENNLPIPQTYYIGSPDDPKIKDISFPVLIKGKFGLSFYKIFGKKAFFASDRENLQKILDFITFKFDINKIYIQELITSINTNKTISFTAFCDRGVIKTFWMGEKIREHPLQFGTATYAQSVNIKRCHDHAVPLLRALQFTGVCEIEYILDPADNEYKLIEVNARTWLWVGLAKACGIDYAKILYAFANNLDVIYPDSYLQDMKWINWLTDTLIVIKALFRNKLKIQEYFRSLKGRKIFAVLARNDLLPSVVFPLLGLSLIKKRRF